MQEFPDASLLKRIISCTQSNYFQVLILVPAQEWVQYVFVDCCTFCESWMLLYKPGMRLSFFGPLVHTDSWGSRAGKWARIEKWTGKPKQRYGHLMKAVTYSGQKVSGQDMKSLEIDFMPIEAYSDYSKLKGALRHQVWNDELKFLQEAVRRKVFKGSWKRTTKYCAIP